MIDFDLASLSGKDRYKLLTASIVPRPIAWITTVSRDGVVNAAPFSYFNVMGTSPAVVAIGVGDRDLDTPKDTARHIGDHGEFVINLVDEASAEAMVQTAVNFPSDISEIEKVGLELVPGKRVAVPRIVGSPIQIECHHHSTIEIGGTRVVLGVGLHIHFREDLVDTEHMYVLTEKAKLVGRMHGRGWYARTDSRVEIVRKSYTDWLRENPSAPDER